LSGDLSGVIDPSELPQNKEKNAMSEAVSRIPWGRMIIVGIVIILASIVIVTLVVTSYAFYLAIQARGAPDQERIGQFAQWISSILSPLLGIVLTFVGARWVRKKVPSAKRHSGLMLGIMVILLSALVDIVFKTPFRSTDLLWFAVILLAGWLGGRPIRSAAGHVNSSMKEA
jgi:hypothetical protein